MPTASTGKMSCWPSATVVMNLASSDHCERQIGPSSLRATCTKPLDQRLCWALKSSSLAGSSPTTCGSIRNTPCQPPGAGRSILERGRQLAGHGRFHQEYAVPASEGGAQHEVEILRQRVVRPAAGLLD